MTLVYPEGNVRSFNYNQTLSQLVNRSIDRVISNEAVFDSVLLEHLWKKRETFTGDRVEWTIYKTDSSAGDSPFFNIFNTTSDGVTATEPNDYLQAQVDPRNAGRKLKLSKIRLAQAQQSKETLRNYLDAMTQGVIIALQQGLSRALFTGNPARTNQSEFGGLNHIIDYDINTNANYASLSRVDSRALIGNKFDATATTTSVTTLSGFTAVNGSNVLTLPSASSGYTPVVGDIADVTDSSGNTRRYRVVGGVDNTGGGNSTILIAPNYEGPGTSGSPDAVTVRVRSAFSDTARYGTAGELTLDKVQFVYSTAVNGGKAPTLGIGNSSVWAELRMLVNQTERSISKSDMSRLGVSGVENFTVLGMPYIIDEHAPAGNLYMVNTDFLKLKTLKGFGDMKLTRDGMRELSTIDGSYATLVGEIVVSGEICSKANNRHALLTGLTV